MPTIERIGPYRFFFYSNENAEPPHVHVESGDGIAKFWLTPVRLETSTSQTIGYNAKEFRKLEEIVNAKQTEFLEAWQRYFANAG